MHYASVAVRSCVFTQPVSELSTVHSVVVSTLNSTPLARGPAQYDVTGRIISAQPLKQPDEVETLRWSTTTWCTSSRGRWAGCSGRCSPASAASASSAWSRSTSSSSPVIWTTAVGDRCWTRRQPQATTRASRSPLRRSTAVTVKVAGHYWIIRRIFK